MAWSDAKAAIKALLASVSISSPSSISMNNVFDDPPPRLGAQDTPACILFPPGVDVERLPGGWRQKRDNYRVRLYIHDPDYATASSIVENMVEAVHDKFDNTSSVRGDGVQIVNGPTSDEPGQVEYAGQTFIGVDFQFDVQMGETKTFG